MLTSTTALILGWRHFQNVRGSITSTVDLVDAMATSTGTAAAICSHDVFLCLDHILMPTIKSKTIPLLNSE